MADSALGKYIIITVTVQSKVCRRIFSEKSEDEVVKGIAVAVSAEKGWDDAAALLKYMDTFLFLLFGFGGQGLKKTGCELTMLAKNDPELLSFILFVCLFVFLKQGFSI